MSMASAQDYQQRLESFLALFREYAAEVFGDERSAVLDELRTRLQRSEPAITPILIEVLGNRNFSTGRGAEYYTLDSLLAAALLGGNNEMPHNFGFFEATATSCLEKALGTLEAGLWPPQEPMRVLAIKDDDLQHQRDEILRLQTQIRVLQEANLDFGRKLADSQTLIDLLDKFKSMKVNVRSRPIEWCKSTSSC